MNDLLNNVNNIVTNNEGEQSFETIKYNFEHGDESAKGKHFEIKTISN